MNWQDEYKSKLTTPQEAVKIIKSGDKVVIGNATGEPLPLVQALLDNRESYQNVDIIAMFTMDKSEWADPENKGHFNFNCLFAAGTNRAAISNGDADFTSIFFHEYPKYFEEEIRPDVMLIQLSSPDSNGYCSFGTAVDFTKPAAEISNIVIAQINKNMPRTMGDSFIHISKLNYICEVDTPLPELPDLPIGETELSIGKNIANLINDGDTLQLGIGGIPNAVLSCLHHKKNLGIHSEMISDGVVDLIKEGVINNSRKNFHKNKSVVSFVMGSKKVYDFVNDNPTIEMRSVDYVNDPVVIMKNDNMVAINSCLQVDLLGQVVSDSIGLNQFSGIGGQVDFVRGANMSRGGRAIIAMPSTAAKGKVSRIVPFINEGSAVSTTRNDVDYIVTEFGVAKLHAKTCRQRAKELINIAHPDFQSLLIAEYERRFNESFFAPATALSEK